MKSRKFGPEFRVSYKADQTNPSIGTDVLKKTIMYQMPATIYHNSPTLTALIIWIKLTQTCTQILHKPRHQIN